MAGGALGTLTVKLGLDAAEFTGGLSKADYEAKKFAENVGRAVDAGVQIAIAGLASLATAGVAAFAAADRLINQAAGYQDLAEKIGGSAEAIASFKTAADTAGVAIDTVAGASIRLTKGLTGVDDESKAAGAALGALGINIKEFKTLSPEQQLEQVAKALAGFENGAQKTAVAMALFGKAGAELLPFLIALEEQGGRQVILTGEQIRQADEYADKVAKVKSEFSQQAQVLATSLIPALSDTFDIVVDVAKSFAQSEAAALALNLAVGTILTVFQAVSVLGLNVAFVFTTIGKEIGSVAAQFAAFGRGDFDQIKVIREAVAADSAAAKKELDSLEQRILNIGKGDGGLRAQEDRGFNPLKKTLDFEGAQKGDKQAEAAAKKAAEATLKEAQRVAEERQKLRIKESQEIEKFFIDQYIAAQRAAEALKKVGQDIYNSTRTPLEKLNIEQAKLADLLEKGVIDWDTYGRAVEAASDAYDKTLEKSEKIGDTAKSIGLAFESAFEDAIVQGKSFGDVLDSLAQDLLKLAVRKTITEPLFDVFGGFLGRIFKGGKAAGGPVQAGSLYRVNENHPELLDVGGQQYLMMGKQGGTVNPNVAAAQPSTAASASPPSQYTYAPVIQIDGQLDAGRTQAMIDRSLRGGFAQFTDQLQTAGRL